MEYVLNKVQDFKIYTRKDRRDQDMNVVREVIIGDHYRVAKLSRFIQPKVILDIGGHIGTFGILVKTYWPDSLLIAVEPNKISYGLYQMNMKANNYKNYHIINAAVGYDKNKTVLTNGFTATGGGFITTLEEAKKLKNYRIIDTNVTLITVEEIIDKFNIDKIELSKWDCEGGEIEIIKNIKSDYTSKFLCIVGEYHLPGGKSSFIPLFKSKFKHLDVYCRRTDNFHIGSFIAYNDNRLKDAYR